MLTNLRDRLFATADISWLVFFRICFGFLMTCQALLYLAHGFVREYWIDPEFHFKYPHFEWVEPLPGEGMIWLHVALAVFAVGVGVGFLYRLSAALLFLGTTYVFLCEQALFQNHSYLICILCFLTIFPPAHRSLSVDARLRPSLRSEAAPVWALWLMRFQIGVPYFFGGVAKLNPDWLIGEPLREWLPRVPDFPIFGPHFTEEWAIYLFSYGGLLLDMLAVPLLLWKRTRTVAFAVLFLFHLSNARLFKIGVFPWMMIVLTTLFFEADWPRQMFYDLRNLTRRGGVAVLGALLGASFAQWLYQFVLLPVIVAAAAGGAVLAWHLARRFAAPDEVNREPASTAGAYSGIGPEVEASDGPGSPGRRTLVALALGVWVLAQVLTPLRHFLTPGHPGWTEEGQRFAWHMKLNDSDGSVVFMLHDAADGARSMSYLERELASWQYKRLTGRPYMIRQYARHLAAKAASEGRPGVEVRAVAKVSLNNREEQLLIDPTVDLARAPLPPPFGHASWIVPLKPRK